MTRSEALDEMKFEFIHKINKYVDERTSSLLYKIYF